MVTRSPFTGSLSETREVQVAEVKIGDRTALLAKTSVGPMDNDCYFIAVDKDCVLIDAATDAEHLLAVAENLGATITDVITTHSHFDHVDALPQILEATGARHHASVGDSPDIPAHVDREIGDGQGLELAGSDLTEVELTGITLHGHTTEGLAIVWSPINEPTHIFSGDSLFPGGVGKTNSREDFDTLISDVAEKIFDRFSDSAVVHPGHGDDTTVGDERPHLDEWKSRGW